MPHQPPSALRVLCESLSVVAEVRDAEDRLYVRSGPRVFVANKGWGLHRYWNGESRDATVRWCSDVTQQVEHFFHHEPAMRLRDANRLLTATYLFRKGLSRLAERVYPDDAAVQEQMVPLFVRVEAVIAQLKSTARSLARKGERSAEPIDQTSSAMESTMPTVRATTATMVR